MVRHRYFETYETQKVEKICNSWLLISLVWHFAILISLEHETFMNIATQKQIQFKSFQIPILVIGTKADMVDDKERIKELNRNGNIGEPANLD